MQRMQRSKQDLNALSRINVNPEAKLAFADPAPRSRSSVVRSLGTNPESTTMAIDSEPPMALDKFITESGLSPATVWRYRRAGWLRTLNISGRHYVTRAEIFCFNQRAAKGEFAKPVRLPVRNKKSRSK